jgi:hypothetical protein
VGHFGNGIKGRDEDSGSRVSSARLLTMDGSADPGTAAALDHPLDVVVHDWDPFCFASLSGEVVSLTDNLRRAGFRVGDGDLSHRFEWDTTPARVNVIIISKAYVSYYFLWSWRENFTTVMRSRGNSDSCFLRYWA